MKRKISIILFGEGFLIAILGEAYLLNAPQLHIFSIVGIGIVVILTGYLFFDSIWEYISSTNKKRDLLWEELLRQDAQKWDSRYTELLNLQKATYTALKKSDTKLEKQIEELSDKLTQITQLQNKAMEGQMKALNISVNYSKVHLKELLEAIKEEKREEQKEELKEELKEEQNDEKAESEISPLYDDPNAALTSEEIEKLFNNYGK